NAATRPGTWSASLPTGGTHGADSLEGGNRREPGLTGQPRLDVRGFGIANLRVPPPASGRIAPPTVVPFLPRRAELFAGAVLTEASRAAKAIAFVEALTTVVIAGRVTVVLALCQGHGHRRLRLDLVLISLGRSAE